MPIGVHYEADETDRIKRAILSAFLDGYNTTLTAACLTAKVSRSVVYEWLDADPEFKASVDAARKVSLNNGLDLAENKLMKKIHEEDRRSIFYFLDRKGGERGYNPKVINENIDATPPAFVQDFGSVTPDVPTPEA